MNQKKKIVILGATGSIGKNTIKVLQKHKNCFQLIGIGGNKNIKQLAVIANQFSVPHVAIYDFNSYQYAKKNLYFSKKSKLYYGIEGLKQISKLKNLDILVVAIVGIVGLEPTLAAIQAKKTIALASKEILVIAGKLIMQEIKKHGATLLPIDSEHSAIFQCLQGVKQKDIDKIILTASGGVCRKWSQKAIRTITVEKALQHPTWRMGKKITIDSVTLANKGLEIIEAYWLFKMLPQQIEVVIHPQSIIHSMIQLKDGAILAQMGKPSMMIPIQYALLYPDRKESLSQKIDFTKSIKLNFEPPNYKKFPCLKLAQQALFSGYTAPVVFNAANEMAVQSFIEKKIALYQIAVVIEKTLELIPLKELKTIKEILEFDKQVRIYAKQILNTL